MSIDGEFGPVIEGLTLKVHTFRSLHGVMPATNIGGLMTGLHLNRQKIVASDGTE